MKIFLLAIIKLYWFLIPKQKRRKCLFKTSCSNYVYEKTKHEGLISGLRALKFRINNCNSNYMIIEIHGEKVLITRANNLIKKELINKAILKNV